MEWIKIGAGQKVYFTITKFGGSHIFNHKIVAPRPYSLVNFCNCLHTHNHITNNAECLSPKRILWIHSPPLQQCKIGRQRNFKYSLSHKDNLCSDVTTKFLMKYKHEFRQVWSTKECLELITQILGIPFSTTTTRFFIWNSVSKTGME